MKISKKARIEVKDIELGHDVVISDECIIEGKTAYIGPHTLIAAGTHIQANHISLGYGSMIGEKSVISGWGGQLGNVELGDFSRIGSNTNIRVPTFRCGDYFTLHNHSSVFGPHELIAGHNCWIGQNTILNTTGPLRLGNNVGIGAYSQLWTHGFWGEIIEGCTFHKIDPVSIEDDAWLIGHCIVYPGVRMGKRAILLAGSVLTKNIPDGAIFGGVPARNMTDKMVAWKPVTLQDKLDMMKRFVQEFAADLGESYKTTESDQCMQFDSGDYIFEIDFPDLANNLEPSSIDRIIVVEGYDWEPIDDRTSVFILATKKYLKKRTKCEQMLIRFLMSHRARFLPFGPLHREDS